MLVIESPERALIRAINTINRPNPPLLVEDVEFGLPEVFLTGDTNSRVVLTMVNTRNYTGSDTHYYNRLRVADYFVGLVIPGKASDYSDIKEAVSAMYNHYHLPLYPDDIVNRDINPVATQVTIQPRNDSLMFIPSLSTTIQFSGS